MSVDDRLRRGLEANATSFRPEGETRLELVHRRRARRRAVVVASAALVVVGSAAGTAWVVGGSSGADRGLQAVAPSSTAPASAGAVPDSSWRRTVTRQQARALGLGQGFLDDNFGQARRLPLVLTFDSGVYTNSGRYPRGWSVGDAGTVAYDDDGALVLTSTSPGCPGCVMTLRWRIDGDDLLLEDPGGALASEDRLMFTGSWSRQPS